MKPNRGRGKRAGAIATLIAVALPALLTAPASAQDLTYSVKEARAYAYKTSLDKLVIEAAPKCDPEEDEYQCDEGKWNHKPNCPPKIEIGPNGKALPPKPVPQVEPSRGGAGENAGGEKPPPQSSPVRLNRIVSLASLSQVIGTKEARGFASEQYVDLSGRSEPEAHTESEAFGTARAYEERCFPQEAAKEDQNDYTHVLSRSSESMATYHFSECLRRKCFFGAPGPGSFGAEAEKATSIVDLQEKDGSVVGKLSSVVEDLKYGGGSLTIDSIRTFVEFSADGTPQGLKWSVTSTAQGAKLGGQPISLPPGEMVSGPGFAVGMAAPYVQAAKDGKKLTIVAAGVTIGTDQQSAFFGGAEVYASAGEDAGFALPPLGETGGPTDIGGGGGGGFDSPVGGVGSVGGVGEFDSAAPFGGDTAAPVAAGDPGEVLIYSMPTGRGAVPLIVGLGILMWFFVMSRWLQRFPWGRKLGRHQPFRTVDWVYRAFVKT